MVSKKRPVIMLPWRPFEMFLEVASILGIIAGFVILRFYWEALPDQIPTHFNIKGQADGWGSKLSLFWVLGIGMFLYLVLTVVEQFPRIYNFPWKITKENAARQYRLARLMLIILKLELIVLLVFILWLSIVDALNKTGGIGPYITIIGVLAVFLTIGGFIYLMYRAR